MKKQKLIIEFLKRAVSSIGDCLISAVVACLYFLWFLPVALRILAYAVKSFPYILRRFTQTLPFMLEREYWKKERIIASSLILSLLLTILPLNYATGPNKITYQGRLREAGQPVSGIRTMQFKIYDVPTGGSPLWTSTVYNVTISTGVYSVIIDMPTTLDWSTGTYYIETIVAGQTLSPREQLTSAVYSLHSGDTDKLCGRTYDAYVSTRAEDQTIAGIKTFTSTTLFQGNFL